VKTKSLNYKSKKSTIMPDKFKLTNDDYYTIKEASDITGIKTDTLYKLIQRKQIEHYNIPGLGVRFSKEQLHNHFQTSKRYVKYNDDIDDGLPF
jgi:excisionase family DNA binding protein